MSTPDNKQIVSVVKLVFWVLIYIIGVIKDRPTTSCKYDAECATEDLENQIKKELDK